MGLIMRPENMGVLEQSWQPFPREGEERRFERTEIEMTEVAEHQGQTRTKFVLSVFVVAVVAQLIGMCAAAFARSYIASFQCRETEWTLRWRLHSHINCKLVLNDSRD